MKGSRGKEGVLSESFAALTSFLSSRCLALSLPLRTPLFLFVSSVADSNSNWAVCGKSSGLVSMPLATGSSQKVQIEVMPLFAGHLPYPRINVLKYLPHTAGVCNQPDPGKHHREVAHLLAFLFFIFWGEGNGKCIPTTDEKRNLNLKLVLNVLRQLHGE